MARIIAHRGSSKLFPENSLAAFRFATDAGSDALEVDLRASKDGVIYCFHDYHLSRTTGFSGYLSRTDSRTIDKLHLDSRQHLLRFDRFLHEFAGRIEIVLDIKSAGIESEIISALGRHATDPAVIYSSFNTKIISRIKTLSPRSHTALIVGPIRNVKMKLDFSANLIERVQALRCNAVHLSKLLAKPGVIKRISGAGCAVAVWTVDNELSARRLINSGVNGIITNLPEKMIHLSKKKHLPVA
ncbi:MAG: glycerophosphodiester phosphodiesterase [Candidatus Zixiibacteriota bacterium]